MSPNAQMLSGAGMIIAALASLHPVVQSAASGLWAKLWSRPVNPVSPTVPTVPVPIPPPINPVIPTPPPFEPVPGPLTPVNSTPVIDSPVAAHLTVTALMAYFARQQDQTGLDLCKAVGQHIYEHNAKQMGLPVAKTKHSTPNA